MLFSFKLNLAEPLTKELAIDIMSMLLFNHKFNSNDPIFDNICSSLNSINNESNWIFSINIQLPSNKEEYIMLTTLMLNFTSSGITHFQILKNNE